MRRCLVGAALSVFGAACATSASHDIQISSAAPQPIATVNDPPRQVASPTVLAPPPACGLAKDVEPVPLPALDDGSPGSTNNLRAWVSTLASPELRGREAGTLDSRRAARLIAERLAQLGALPASGSDYCHAFELHGVRDQNVVGHLDAGTGKWIVLGAHYDGLGVDKNGLIHPGADDNATGVAVLLEVAHQLIAEQRAASTPQHGPNVAFVAFGAEELGLYGSEAYIAAPSVPLAQVGLMINIDMAGHRLGDNAGIGYEASGEGRARTTAWVRDASRTSSVGVAPMRLGDRSDSAWFAPHVPTVFFSTTIHADYHRTTDTADRVDYAQVTRAARLVLALIEGAPR